MKIKNAPLSRGPQRHAGLWYVKRQRGGQLAVQKWPRKYGGPKTQAAKDAQKVWGEANHHSTRPFSMDGAEAVNFSQGTPFLPRDILMKAAYGTLVEANFKDGRTLRSAREVATNAQILLDQITTTPGAMLLRTADEWVGLDPGDASYVLTSNGPQALPKWLPASGGGGGGSLGSVYNAATGTAFSSSQHNWKGTILHPLLPLQITAIIYNTTATVTRTLQGELWSYAAGKLVERASKLPPLNVPVGDNVYAAVTLASPITITPDAPLMLLLANEQATATDPVQPTSPSSWTAGIPMDGASTDAWVDQAELAAGVAYTTGSSPFGIGFTAAVMAS